MRKTYEKSFKIEIAKKIRDKKESVSSVSTTYNISKPIVSRWVSEFNRCGNKVFSGKGNRLPDRANQYALEEENKRLKEEIEILKKFALFFKREKL